MLNPIHDFSEFVLKHVSHVQELKDSKDPKAADPVPDAAIPTAAETSATNAEPAPEISAGQDGSPWGSGEHLAPPIVESKNTGNDIK